MSTRVWRGDAPAVAQVDTLTVGGTIEADDLFIITINGKSLSTPAGSTVAATVATTIAAAFNASEIPEFKEITALATSGGALTLTADVPGVPFTVTVLTTETGGGSADSQTFGRSATTANSGPKDWGTAANWSGGAVPVNSDDVVFENSANDCLYGLDQNAVTLTSLTIKASFTGKIGLPRNNPLGYTEYRQRYLKVGATTVKVGQGSGAGSSRILLDTDTDQTNVEVLSTGSAQGQGEYPLVWKGSHASNELTLQKGVMAICPEYGETAQLDKLYVGFRTNKAGDSTLYCGTGLTNDEVFQSGGTLTLQSNVTSLSQKGGGVAHLLGSMTVGVLTSTGGQCFYETSGTMTAGSIQAGAVLDFTRDMSARTVTDLTALAPAKIIDSGRSVTWSNGIIAIGGLGAGKVDIDLGTAQVTLEVS